MVLDELADEIPGSTLIRLSEEDVSLDMDEAVVINERDEFSDGNED